MNGVDEPLTDEARWAKLQELLGDDFDHLGELFLPTAEFYNSLTTDKLPQAAKQLFHWLGLKPHRLHIQTNVTMSRQPKSLVVGEDILHFPYLAGSILAHEVLGYYFATKKYSASQAFVEYASAKMGFGLVVLNGTQPHRRNHAYLHHLLNGHWHLADHDPLTSYTAIEYAKEFEQYLTDYRISPKIWADYASPYTASLMPTLKKYQETPQLPSLEIQHHKHSRNRLIKAVLAAILASIVTAVGLFVWAQRPFVADAALTEKYQDIQTLQRAYQLCQDKANLQMRQLNPDDMSSDSQINATLSRCQSLRNEYNYAVDNYNKYLK